MTYLVDSDWTASYLNGRSDAVQLLRRLWPEGLALSVISFGEVQEGILFGLDPATKEEGFRVLLEGLTLLPVTVEVMRQFASVRGQLRRQGQLIPDMDLLIASTALEHDLTLLTRNRRHFERVPGCSSTKPRSSG